jgi:tripartite-type tricarboxylate transporter receptor subunit TctC
LRSDAFIVMIVAKSTLQLQQISPPLSRPALEEDMRGFRALILAIVLIAAAVGDSRSQATVDYPNRPVRVVVPVGAGAGMDNAARLMAAAAEPNLGQSFVIENKPSASSRLGAGFVAKAPADGYTLLFTGPSPIVVSEFFPPRLDFNPGQDFRPVLLAMFQPALLVVRQSLGVTSLDAFVAYAKANPDKLSFGMQGFGGEMHLALERFKASEGVAIRAIPYNAGAQIITDLLADRLDAMFVVVPPIKGHLASGKLQPLATLNGTRIKALPDVPTMAELGRPDMTTTIWFGFLAPAKVPQAAVDRLVRAFEPLRKDSALAGKLEEIGVELSLAGPEEFGKIIRDDRAKNGKIVAERNLGKAN